MKINEFWGWHKRMLCAVRRTGPFSRTGTRCAGTAVRNGNDADVVYYLNRTNYLWLILSHRELSSPNSLEIHTAQNGYAPKRRACTRCVKHKACLKSVHWRIRYSFLGPSGRYVGNFFVYYVLDHEECLCESLVAVGVFRNELCAVKPAMLQSYFVRCLWNLAQESFAVIFWIIHGPACWLDPATTQRYSNACFSCSCTPVSVRTSSCAMRAWR